MVDVARQLTLQSADALAMLRALMRDLNVQTRNGRPVPAWAHRVLPELAGIADSPIDGSDTGTSIETLKGTDWLQMVSIEEAANQVGRSPE
ncbi:hypothetical protein, partial [Nocardioides sp. GCM10030258]